MYGGRASDKFITSDSEDLLQNLESSKGSAQSSFGSTYIRFTHELKVEETDPTEIENLTAKSSTNKPTFKRTIVRKNSSINGSFRSGPLQMGITYVSRMYGGRASDKVITSESEDLLQNLESSKGSVMADRGFLINDKKTKQKSYQL
jgi:hypothetical protein